VAGFYLPLRRSGERLQVRVDEAETSLRQHLEESRAQLLELESARDKATALAREIDTQNVALVDVKERIARLEQRLAGRFRLLRDAQMLNVTSAGDRLSIALSTDVLFPGDRATIPKNGRILLCQLSKILLEELSEEIRVTGYFGKAQIEGAKLKSLYDSTWELSAVRAATVAKVLERGCGAPTDRFLVVGYGPRPAGPLGANVAFEMIVKPGK
jgi:chemotaxis protein MotB